MPEPTRPVDRRARHARIQALRGRLRARTRAARGQEPEERTLQPGFLARLWPADKPVYKRPAAIGGGVLVVAALAWYLLGGGGGEGGEPEEEGAEK